jgi:hypothetical protein
MPNLLQLHCLERMPVWRHLWRVVSGAHVRRAWWTITGFGSGSPFLRGHEQAVWHQLLRRYSAPCCRDMSKRYGIKYFYDITDRSNFRANPDYKGVCHIAMAQEGHCLPGAPALTITPSCVSNCIMRAGSDMLLLSGQVLCAVAALLQTPPCCISLTAAAGASHVNPKTASAPMAARSRTV